MTIEKTLEISFEHNAGILIYQLPPSNLIRPLIQSYGLKNTCTWKLDPIFVQYCHGT